MHVLLSLESNKQTAESKQTHQNDNFSYLTTLYSTSKVISASIHKSSPEEEVEEDQLSSIDLHASPQVKNCEALIK